MSKTDFPNSEVTSSKQYHRKLIEARDVKGVYQNRAEIERAKANKTFDIAKTMYLAKNGQLYFLCDR